MPLDRPDARATTTRSTTPSHPQTTRSPGNVGLLLEAYSPQAGVVDAGSTETTDLQPGGSIDLGINPRVVALPKGSATLALSASSFEANPVTLSAAQVVALALPQ